MAAYPDDWTFELFIQVHCEGFQMDTMSTGKLWLESGKLIEDYQLPVTNNPNVVWYLDENYTAKALETPFENYVDIYDDGKTMTYGTLNFYGRLEGGNSSSSTGLHINFKTGLYDKDKFNNEKDEHLSHSAGTLYFAKQDFLKSYLIYDDGENFLDVVPRMLSQDNGGTGVDLSLIEPYSTLIQNADGTGIGYVKNLKGAYFNSTGAGASPAFGILPISCGGTGTDSISKNMILYSDGATFISSNHFINSTKIAINSTTLPTNYTFFVNGATGLSKGHLYLTESAANSSTANKTQIIFGTPQDEHVALSSNTNALVINPSSSQTTNQIVLYLGQQSLFPKGLSAGSLSVTGTTVLQNTNILNKLILKDTITYGTEFPDDPEEGQIFFKLIEEDENMTLS